jgi:beta-N-acetylhexosaminidase
VDQEGGRVQRFRGEFTRLPPLGTLAGVYDQDPGRACQLAETTGWLMASELLALGVDLSFAPILDLDRGISQVIGDRAFHSDPEAVAVLGRSDVEGMRRGGMAATGKHFPGHGSVQADSHVALPQDTRSRADIMAEDLLPFERLIQSGVAAVMMAHVIYSDVDPLPASFSPYWIETVLRRQLGFQGVVFSDDLGMEAACAVGDFVARALAAVKAGCDMILLCNNADQIARVLEAIPDPDPAASIRLARLHGKRSDVDWRTLRGSATWRAAVSAVSSYC